MDVFPITSFSCIYRVRVCVDARQYLVAALVYMYIYTGDAFNALSNQLIDLPPF